MTNNRNYVIVLTRQKKAALLKLHIDKVKKCCQNQTAENGAALPSDKTTLQSVYLSSRLCNEQESKSKLSTMYTPDIE